MELPSDLVRRQDGVLGRDQLLAAGLTTNDLRRLLRHRELTQIHPGVYLNHTGEPTPQQRAWAAVRLLWPAALSHGSALFGPSGAPTAQPTGLGRPAAGRSWPLLHVAVDRKRHLVAPPGVVLHHQTGFDDLVQWNLSPPRVRFEEAVLDVAASARSELEVIAVLADAVSGHRTTATRLMEALDRRRRVRGRALIRAVLADVALGTCSVLEHRYLTDVERAHGLPTGERQARGLLLSATPRGEPATLYRDVLVRHFSTVIELDGSLHHNHLLARSADLSRDLAAACQELLTVRLSWGQVVDRPCHTARLLAELFRSRGWTGALVPCGRCR